MDYEIHMDSFIHHESCQVKYIHFSASIREISLIISIRKQKENGQNLFLSWLQPFSSICNTIIHLLTPGSFPLLLSIFWCPLDNIWNTATSSSISIQAKEFLLETYDLGRAFKTLIQNCNICAYLLKKQDAPSLRKFPPLLKTRFNAQVVQCHELSLGVMGNPVQSHHCLLTTHFHMQPLCLIVAQKLPWVGASVLRAGRQPAPIPYSPSPGWVSG